LGTALLVGAFVFTIYGLNLIFLRRRLRKLSASMEQFVASGFQGTALFGPSRTVKLLPDFLIRTLGTGYEIAMVESGAELMASAIQESKRRMMDRERAHLDWLAFLCHDLGAPLLRVLTRIEALEYSEELTPKEAHIALDSAHLEITQMAQLISSVNDFAQTETDARREFEEICIDPILEHVVAVFEFDANRKSIELDLRIIPGIGTVRVEKLLIRRALENLISNAIRFTPEGGLISVRAERFGDTVCLSVADSGSGILTEDIDRIFEFRYRGKVQGDPNRCGSLGLGLALVRRVVELHHGDVVARNLELGGAEFVISLPAGHREDTDCLTDRGPTEA
jgi:signal transduction histidine kinase